ncbi:hypothetical protein AZG88_02630 [Rhodococcus sp. LB1]|nr:hypothetical protein AZG88_02630 [Rhodococcus sp. LB1]
MAAALRGLRPVGVMTLIAHIAGGFETATGAVTGSRPTPLRRCSAVNRRARSPTSTASARPLFSALTGHAAFERRSGEQVVAQFLRITTQEVPDLREHGIPGDVSGTIARAMCRTPDQRPATAADPRRGTPKACNATKTSQSMTWPSAYPMHWEWPYVLKKFDSRELGSSRAPLESGQRRGRT